jgi:hypothetical protein
MHLVIHQLKKEFLAQRTGLLAFAAVLTVYVLFAATGFAGEFERPATRPLVAIVFELLAGAIGIIPFVLAAAIGIADPPVDEEAHWRALPIRPHHLLLSKLLVLAVGIMLPLLLVRTLALTALGLQAWFYPMLMDLLSNIPAWLALGLAIGALTGDWKKFTMTMVAILAGNALVITSLEGFRDYFRGDSYRILEDGLEGFATTNVFFPGAVTILVCRYFTRWKKGVLMGTFAGTILVTIFFFPSMTRSLVPSEPVQQLAEKHQAAANVTLPSQLFTLTNSTPKRVAHLSYTNLDLVGLSPTDFIEPLRLISTLQVHSQDGTSTTNLQTSYFDFPGSPFWYRYNSVAPALMARHLLLGRAVPSLKIINPPFGPGDGFNLYEINEEMIAPHASQKIDLSAELKVELGTYKKIAELPLDESSSVVLASGKLALVRLQPQVAGRTQILVNELYLRFVEENDHPMVRQDPMGPSRDPIRLRYILVNQSRQEACLPVKQVAYRIQRLHPLSMRSSIIDFSIPAGPSKDEAPSEEWLDGAILHVFRKLPRGKSTIQINKEDLRINSLPLLPYPKETQIDYR